MCKVSVIIVNYNSSQLTIEAINSVVENTKEISYEIIVVDNASSPEQINIIQEYCEGKENIVLILSKKNLGFGRANNLGSLRANSNTLFFLNPDTILLNNAILLLYKKLWSDSKIAICGGQLFDTEGTEMHSYSMFLPGFWRDFDTAVCGSLTTLLRKIKDKDFFNVGYITGADLMIKKTIFNEVDGFDPDFFMYYEESEMSHRIKKSGYSIKCFKAAKIVHLEGKTQSFNDNKLRMIFTGRLLYLRKTKNKLTNYFTHISYLFLNHLNKLRLCLRKDKENEERVTNKIKIYKEVYNTFKI